MTEMISPHSISSKHSIYSFVQQFLEAFRRRKTVWVTSSLCIELQIILVVLPVYNVTIHTLVRLRYRYSFRTTAIRICIGPVVVIDTCIPTPNK